MISKLIAYGEDRAEVRPSLFWCRSWRLGSPGSPPRRLRCARQACDRLQNALDEYVIHGVQHNTPFLRACLSNDKFLSGARPANLSGRLCPT